MSDTPRRSYFLMPADREWLRLMLITQDDVRTEAQRDAVPVRRDRKDGDAAPRS